MYRSWGVPNFLPVFSDGEGEETMQDHSEQLRQKLRVSHEKQDTAIINNLMDMTFPHQRHLLIADMEKIIKSYWFMFSFVWWRTVMLWM